MAHFLMSFSTKITHEKQRRRKEEKRRTIDSFQSEQREKANVFFLKKKQRDREKQLQQIFYMYSTCRYMCIKVGCRQ